MSPPTRHGLELNTRLQPLSASSGLSDAQQSDTELCQGGKGRDAGVQESHVSLRQLSASVAPLRVRFLRRAPLGESSLHSLTQPHARTDTHALGIGKEM